MVSLSEPPKLPSKYSPGFMIYPPTLKPCSRAHQSFNFPHLLCLSNHIAEPFTCNQYNPSRLKHSSYYAFKFQHRVSPQLPVYSAPTRVKRFSEVISERQNPFEKDGETFAPWITKPSPKIAKACSIQISSPYMPCSQTIQHNDFSSRATKTFYPHIPQAPGHAL